MARGDKNYRDVVTKVNKGAKSKKKIAAVHKMVEAMINGDTDEAANELSDYIRMSSREILLGEAADEEDEDDDTEMTADDDDSDDDSDDADESDDDEDDDSDDDDDSDESDDDAGSEKKK